MRKSSKTPPKASQPKDREFKDFFYEKTFRETQRKAEDNYDEQIKSLENDKVGLIKRLNMVLVELDRATQEKNDLNSQILQQYKISEELQRKLERASTMTNVLSKTLQEDLQYERELNSQLRDEINKYEVEKNKLYGIIKDVELIEAEAQETAKRLTLTLQQKEEDMEHLLQEYQLNVDNLNDLNRQIQDLEQNHVNNREEQLKLNEDLDNLNKERHNMINRMNELTVKYEGYVEAMAKEREEISKANKRHIKLLSSKLLFGWIESNILVQYKQAYGFTRRFAEYDRDLRKSLCNTIFNITTFNKRRMRGALHRWHDNCIEWTKENIKKDRLVDATAKTKAKIKFFNKWRKAYLEQAKKFDAKIDSGKQLTRLFFKYEGRRELYFFNKWKDATKFLGRRDRLIKKSINKWYLNRVGSAFMDWCIYANAKKERLKFNTLVEVISTHRFKSRMFSQLRMNIRKIKDQKVVNVMTNVKENTLLSKKRNFLKSATKVTLSMMHRTDDRLLKMAFDSLKHNRVDEQYIKTNDELNIERPRRQELEVAIQDLEENDNEGTKNWFMKAICIYFKKRLGTYFEQWRRVNHKYQANLVKMRRILLKMMNYKLWAGFAKWKRTSDTMTEEMSLMSKSMIDQGIEDIMKEKERVGYELSRFENLNKKNRNNKLQRVIRQRVRRELRRIVRNWKNSAIRLKSVEMGGMLLKKRYERNIVKNGFKKYKTNIQKTKRGLLVNFRMEFLHVVGARRTLKKMFEAWLLFKNNNKKMKLVIIKMRLRTTKDKVDKAFQKWKLIINIQKKSELINATDELIAKNEALKQDIALMQNENVSREENQKLLVSKLVNQSRTIMAKFAKRMLHHLEGQAFHTWRDLIKKENKQCTLVKKTLNKWYYDRIKEAFTKWKEDSHFRKVTEQKKLHEQERLKHKRFKKKSSMHLLKQQENIEDTKFKINLLQNQKDFHQRRFDKLMQYFHNKSSTSYHAFNLRYVMDGWRDMIDSERVTTNRLMKISKKYIFTNIFVRMREIHLQNKDNNQTTKKLGKFFRIVKKFQCKYAFHNWRNDATEKMMTQIESAKMECQATQMSLLRKDSLVKKKCRDKCLNNCFDRQKRRVLKAWQQRAKLQKLLKTNKKTLIENMRHINVKSGFKKWRDRKNATLRRRRRIQKALRHYFKYLQSRYFNYWIFLHESNRILPLSLKKLENRIFLNHAKYAFTKIHNSLREKKHLAKNTKLTASETMATVMKKLLHKKVANIFEKLKVKSRNKEISEVNLKRIMLKCLFRKLDQYFHKWRNQKNNLNTMEFMTIEGPRAMEKCELVRELETMKEFMDKNHYHRVPVKAGVVDRETDKSSALKKAAEKWKNYKTDMGPVKNAIDQWRMWLKLRKMFERAADFANKRNKFGPLHAVFNRWKKYKSSAAKPLNPLSKSDLIKKCMDDDCQMRKLKKEADDYEKSLENLMGAQSGLLANYGRGKRIAVALLSKFAESLLREQFSKWRRKANQQKIQEMRFELDMQIRELARVRAIHLQLDETNKDLLVENEDLRQASLDGIEIAKAVQELTQEREQLSVDLADRSMTVKKLVEDNANLKERIRLAQRESQKLVALTQGQAIPEDDEERSNGGIY